MDGRGDGDLTNRFGEFAVTDPQPLGPGGEITRYRVDPRVKPGDALDEEAVVNAGDQVGLALRPGEERERLGADGRSALEAASDGRPGRGRTSATGGIRIVQKGLQFAVDDQGGPAGSDALAVEGARRERRRVGGIIDKGDHRVGDDVAESVGEHRAALQHRFTGEGVTDDAEELSGHPRVEHDR